MVGWRGGEGVESDGWMIGGSEMGGWGELGMRSVEMGARLSGFHGVFLFPFVRLLQHGYMSKKHYNS